QEIARRQTASARQQSDSGTLSTRLDVQARDVGHRSTGRIGWAEGAHDGALQRRLSVRDQVLPLLGKEGPRLARSRAGDQAFLRRLLLSARSEGGTVADDRRRNQFDDAR